MHPRLINSILLIVAICGVSLLAQPVPSGGGAGANLTLSNVNPASVSWIGTGANQVPKLDSSGNLTLSGIVPRTGTAATNATTVFAAGEIATDSDDGLIRIGDNLTNGGTFSFYPDSANRYAKISNNGTDFNAGTFSGNIGVPGSRYSTQTASFSVSADQGGQIIDVDTSAGNVIATIPAATSLRPGWTVGLRKSSSGDTNTLTTSGVSSAITISTRFDILWVSTPDGATFKTWQQFGRSTGAGNIYVGNGLGGMSDVALSGAATVSSAGTVSLTGLSGSSIAKGNGSGGLANAVASTDYAPATTGSAILKANGSGGFSAASSGTDYAPATTGSTLLKANGSGGFAAATRYVYFPWYQPTSATGTLSLLNAPLAETEFPATSGGAATTHFQMPVDLSGYTQFALIYLRTAASSSGASPVLYGKYTTNGGSSWSNLATSSNPQIVLNSGTDSAMVISTWTNLDPSAAASGVVVDFFEAGGDASGTATIAKLGIAFR